MHSSALVIVPAEGVDDVEKWVDELMAPYSENDPALTWEDDEDHSGHWWDWYRIGGRWDGYHLGLDSLPEETHYTDAWSQPERNSAPVKVAAEWNTYTVVSPEGFMHREHYNPAWADHGYPPDVEPTLPTEGFHQWRAEQLIKYRDGIVVVVDYHS